METLTFLRSYVNQQSRFQINVQRNRLWDSFKEATDKPSYDPFLKPDVIFVDEDGNGEGGVDNGGPTTELLTLLMEEVMRRKVWMHARDQPNNRYLTLNYQGKPFHYVSLGTDAC